VVVDHFRACVVVAVLCGIAYRIAHVFETTLIDEIDDELELVEASK
jgi:hypothetical protein